MTLALTKPLRSVIAIDGPAGVGKSTVARLIAKSLGFTFLNTGDMYRALTWKALRDGVNIRDRGKVSGFLRRSMNWEFKRVEGTIRIFVEGQELGREPRSERVSRETPTVAAQPAVRRFMRRTQAEMARKGRVVLEGRDTTTHVVPEAELKIYLDAPAEERAKRRYHQLVNDGKRVKLSSIEKAIRTRDMREIKRRILPAKRSPQTIVLDTTHLTLHAVADTLMDLYKKKTAPR